MRTRRAVLIAVMAVPLAAQTYTYDSAGRLTRAAYPQGGGVSYQYDASDNLISVASLSVPAAPSGVQVSRTGANTVQVSWTAAAGASGYLVQRSLAGSSDWTVVATLTANQLSYLDQSALAGQEYAYRVSALGADGSGAYSQSASTQASGNLPAISQNGIVNGASFDANQPIAPGSLISIFGINFGFNAQGQPLNSQAGAPPLPFALAGHSVTIGGLPAPLYLVYGRDVNGQMSGQLNAQVPWNAPLGDAVQVVVTRDSGGAPVQSVPQTVRIAAVSPALFTFSYGAGAAAVVNNDDASISQPAGSIPGVSTKPAPRGGVILIFATGLGPVSPPSQDGYNSADALRQTTNQAHVLIGGVEAQVLFSGLSPQYAGLYQINAVVAPNTPTGNAVPIQVQIAGAQSRNDVTIAIGP